MALVLNGSNDTITGLQINSANIVDGSIVNSDINSSAAIASTKLSVISMADSWRITSDFTGDQNVMSSNWERFDTSPWENKLGTGLTESSGVFTFPSTGYYFLVWVHYARHNAHSAWNEMELSVTNDGGSNYTQLNHTEMSWKSDSTDYKKAVESTILDITNVSNQKFYFKMSVDNNSVITIGASNKKQTGFDIFRLGDT